MKKRAGSKASKREKTDLPELVTVMAKLVERLEALERKTDLIISRIADLPQEIKRAGPDVRRPEPPPHLVHGSPPNHASRERILYQAVCADCRKNCEVPFKPTGERPVYCKECFAQRKAGHIPQDPDRRVEALHRQRKLIMPSPGAGQGTTPKSAASLVPPPAAKRKKSRSRKKKK